MPTGKNGHLVRLFEIIKAAQARLDHHGVAGPRLPTPSQQPGWHSGNWCPLKTRRETFYLLGAAQSHPGSRARGRPLCRRSSLCRVAAELGTRHLQVAEDLRCPNSSHLLPELFAVQYKLLRHPLSDSTSISLFQDVATQDRNGKQA